MMPVFSVILFFVGRAIFKRLLTRFLRAKVYLIFSMINTFSATKTEVNLETAILPFYQPNF